MREDAHKLERYNAKRDFDLTEEPSGRAKKTKSGRSFVIQKHDARRLHYDFRLEHDGVLWSWAVPKGPSLSPKDKRLAVRTEDHPVDYRDFEGNIPDGQYGGGPVIVWDRGSWEPLGDPDEMMKKGRIHLRLDAEKLQGEYMLVRTAGGRPRDDGSGASWLLFKRSDEHAREGRKAEIVSLRPESVLTGRKVEEVEAGEVPRRGAKKRTPKKAATTRAADPLPDTLEPQLARLVDAVPTRGDWVYELKYDGYRILAWKRGDDVRLVSRNGKDWTDNFGNVAKRLARVRARDAIFDGEVAYVLPDGRTDFQHLQNSLSAGRDDGHLVYFAFDLLYCDGEDLRGQPLRARKDRLRTIFAGEKPPLMLGDHVDEDGEVFFAQACKLGLEGIVAKRGDRPYVSGRGPDWVKVKCQKRQELVICGFTAPKGSRTGIGALLLAVPDGGALTYAGKVGTGFSAASLKELAAKLLPRVVEHPSIEGAPRMRDATWVRPDLVCEVRFTEWTRDGALRHPSFQGLREDKRARDVVREREAPAPPEARAKKTKKKTGGKRKPR